jgi:sialate O-acetylesterase
MQRRTTGWFLLWLCIHGLAQARDTTPDVPSGHPPLLHEMFQDHAVLQRDKPIKVWGHAAPGERVTVSLASSDARARADASGSWQVQLPPLPAGGPFVLTARGASGTTQTASDILVGDVFLCSGQSNMEWPVSRARDADEEISTAALPEIRMLTVQHATASMPVGSFQTPVSWQVAGPDTVGSWSAVCFFFARELRKSTHTPIGLIHSSWGGSNIRPWISATALRGLGSYDPALALLALHAQDPKKAQAQFGAQWEDWWRAHTRDASGQEPWQPNANGSWRTAPAALGDWRTWGVPELEHFTGLVWYRTHVILTAQQAQSAATLNLGPINQIDETWVNGRTLGNTFGYGTERTYTIDPGLLHEGDNVVVVNVLSTYGRGGLLGDQAARSLRFANGESVPLHGPWQYAIAPVELGYPPQAPWQSVAGLTTMYNAMIAPLGAFGLKGVLWYQGESNTGEPQTYEALLTALMADWRRQFGAGLPFLIVQLPQFGRESATPVESGWASLRDAQRQAVAKDSHAALAVTIDIGDPRNLHPANKQDVGTRLARAARHLIYGEPVTPSGPVAHAAIRRGADAVAVEFNEVDGELLAYSHRNPIGFELCGDAVGSCRYAQSRIEGTRVVLAVGEMPAPTRVRYCWGDSPICNLFDGAGLPAGPFEMRISD